MIRFLPYIIGVAIVVTLITSAYLKGRSDKSQEILTKELRQTQADQEVLNEIRNNRLDDAGLIDSLQSGSF